MAYTDIEVHKEGAVRVLTINRPQRRNAMTAQTVSCLYQELESAESDPEIGAVVLTGAGGHFSAGGDIDAIVQVARDGSDETPMKFMRIFHRLVETVWTSPLPVVASVSGIAYGGAFNLALACDLIVCSADARFCEVFLRRGITADLGGAYLLPRLVGMQRAKELILLTPEISALRAQELGLVNAVLPDATTALAHAIDLSAQLAAGPRFAISQTKKLLNASMDGTLQSSLNLEASVQSGLLRSNGAKSALDSFIAGTR